MNTGIYLSHVAFQKNLYFHLKDLRNHIQLIFPYLDYGLNYKQAEFNKIANYENKMNLEDFKITEGCIIPNYKLENSQLHLREFLFQLQNSKSDMNDNYPLFFVIKNKIDYDLDKLSLFDNSLNIKNFKFLEILNTNKEEVVAPVKIFIEKIKQYEVIVIRPDFVIEKLL
jgi:hypothetical protein